MSTDILGIAKKIPEELFKARRLISMIAIAELFLTAAMIIIQSLGLTISTTYGLLLIFQTLHVFSWMAALAVGVGMFNLNFLLMFITLYGFCILTELISGIWRIILLVMCDVDSTCRSTTSFVVASWITWGISIALLLIDILFIWLGITVVKSTRKFGSDIQRILQITTRPKQN